MDEDIVAIIIPSDMEMELLRKTKTPPSVI